MSSNILETLSSIFSTGSSRFSRQSLDTAVRSETPNDWKQRMIKNAFFTGIFLSSLFISSIGCAGPSQEEQALGPWLDLTGGGQAVGPAQTMQVKNSDGTLVTKLGSLQNGTLLPPKGDGFVRLNSPNTTWATGMMASLITNATAEYTHNAYPGSVFYIGSIAQQFGGPYKPHKSHQNGLDADILFADQTSYTSVLDSNGQVTSSFDAQKNWDFWRMLVQQQILQKGQPTTVVSMILVAPPIKAYLCDWAKQQGHTDPLDLEVLRRLHPTVGHDDHFHLRLKCSPYHSECLQQGDIASGTGC